MTRTFKCNIFFLSDSTTRPSDLSLYVIVESGNSCSVSLKSCFKLPHPFWGDLGRNENRPRPLPLTPMLNPFFSQNRALNAFSMASGRARPGLVISSGRKSLYERHTALTEAYSVKMASAQCNSSNSILSLKETPFGRRNNEDKLATLQLGPPRPNITIKQVATKKGKSYTRGFSKN